MKKFFTRTCLVTTLLIGLMAFGIGTTEVAAQGDPKEILKMAPANWLASVDALDVLRQQVAALDLIMQGTPYLDIDYKRKYYNCISISIEQGRPVGEAVNTNLALFVTGLNDDPVVEIPNPLPLATWRSIYLEITNLLKQ